MLKGLTEIGVSGSVGALTGIGLVIWIEPTTKGGIGLIIAVAVLVSIAVGAIFKTLFGRNKKSKAEPS